ncbi:hypothetical protein [Sphingomonas sp.]|uniref:hypothetical protein n=1 Tax=Sphingomonas sp. TaxID=28214 RepID=UPI002E2F55ED|nr:hypothetical protein [Sphingomonas sp.]HEX4694361.1 hypothetical protein [Sphingomonas sp.]
MLAKASSAPARPADERSSIRPYQMFANVELISEHGMDISRITVLGFALLAIGIDVWGIVTIIRAPGIRYKPLWIIGSLIGFIG